MLEPCLMVSPALGRLQSAIRRLDSVLVCFSGGIDSALVSAIAHRQLGERAVALTALSPSLAPVDRLDAERTARALGIQHVLRDSHELSRPGYVKNGSDRCYHCKSELYTIAERERRALGLAHIANGSNLDDLGDYRPGLKAASEAGVESPLITARLTKADVRAVAREIGLELWSKPAGACLASRLPYGSEVQPERLAQIATFEAALRELGFPLVRVRWHDTVARIEVPSEDLLRLCTMSERAQALGRASGFHFITVDLGGYRRGSLNELLEGRRLRIVS